jgi:hypothetical protein
LFGFLEEPEIDPDRKHEEQYVHDFSSPLEESKEQK